MAVPSAAGHGIRDGIDKTQDGTKETRTAGGKGTRVTLITEKSFLITRIKIKNET